PSFPLATAISPVAGTTSTPCGSLRPEILPADLPSPGETISRGPFPRAATQILFDLRSTPKWSNRPSVPGSGTVRASFSGGESSAKRGLEARRNQATTNVLKLMFNSAFLDRVWPPQQ